MQQTHEDRLREKIETISNGAWQNLHQLEGYGDAPALQIVSTILQYACQGQHVGGIIAGRNAFSRLSAGWLDAHLSDAVDATLNLHDEWEYRRLLELLAQSYPPELSRYVEQGKRSSNAEVVEAAFDFASS